MSSATFTRTQLPGKCSASTATRCAKEAPLWGTVASIGGAVHCTTVLAQELFTALLISPVTDLGAVSANKDDQLCDITVGDVIGPLKQGVEEGERDGNFSLLSYSFSLVSSHL